MRRVMMTALSLLLRNKRQKHNVHKHKMRKVKKSKPLCRCPNKCWDICRIYVIMSHRKPRLKH
jgi:MinD superfamily P-loop ATPase